MVKEGEAKGTSGSVVMKRREGGSKVKSAQCRFLSTPPVCSPAAVLRSLPASHRENERGRKREGGGGRERGGRERERERGRGRERERQTDRQTDRQGETGIEEERERERERERRVGQTHR